MRVTYLRDGYFVVHFSHLINPDKQAQTLTELGFTADVHLRYWWTKDPAAAFTAIFCKEREG